MKPGQGAGELLADITKGLSRDAIRERYIAGRYGKAGERPRGDYVDAWLKLAGK